MKYNFKDIQHKLSLSLPGEDAHKEVSPTGRSELSKALKESYHFKKSAVALILFEKDTHLNLLLIERPSYNDYHSGEICFPGGKQEIEDKDLLSTSLRESYEETGLLKNHFDLLGELTPIYIPVSRYFVKPYVFYYAASLTLQPSSREVAEIFSFPIEKLFDKNIIKQTKISLSNGMILNNVPYFDINNKIVWGATALMLNELRWVLKT